MSPGGGKGARSSSGQPVAQALSQIGIICKERQGWIDIPQAPVQRTRLGEQRDMRGWQVTSLGFRLEVSKTLTVRVSNC